MQLFGFEEFWEALVWKYWRASVETMITEHNIWKGITGLYESECTHPPNSHLSLASWDTVHTTSRDTWVRFHRLASALQISIGSPSTSLSALIDSPWVLWVLISTASKPHSTLSGPDEPVGIDTSSWVVLGWVFENLPLCSQIKGASWWSAWWLWGTLMWMTMVIWVFSDERRWNEWRWSWWT